VSPYSCFDHTGDVGIEVLAGTREELFAEAAVALVDLAVGWPSVVGRETQQVSISAFELDLLMVDWLSEILFLFDARSWLVARAQVTIDPAGGLWRLAAALDGEPFDVTRHAVRLAPKAVTYHALEVGEADGRWRARVVLDV
jgi:SHS2 domain-containing protein